MRTLLLTIPTLAKILSGDSITRGVTLCIQLWFFFLSRKFFGSRHDLLVECTFNGTRLPIYLRYPMDIAVLREIFIDREYDWFPIEDPKVIVDLGAHFGDTALYYHARYPEATIIAVEPAPESFARLQKNTAGVDRIIPVHAAVGGNDGTIELNLVESSLGHSVTQRKGMVGKVEVPLVTLKTLLLGHGVERADLVKFDIEGGEESLFTFNSPKEIADAYIGEVHEDLISTDSKEFMSRFDGFVVEKVALPNARRFVLKAILEK